MSRLTDHARVVTVTALVALAAVTLAARQAQTVTVSGRVVDAGTGTPIQGAVVEALIGSRRQGIAVLTDETGAFHMTGVPAGGAMRAVIAASKPGYLGGGADQQRPGDLRRSFALNDGDVSGITLRLWGAGSISGRVVDSAGAPIPNALVKVIEAGPADVERDNRLSRIARTDDRGVYEISPVLPETYIVFVETSHVTHPSDAAQRRPPMVRGPRPAPPVRFTSEDGGFFSPIDHQVNAAAPRAADGREAVFVNTAYPNASDLATSIPVTIGSGEHRTNVDITMRSVPRVRVRGVVIAPDERLPRLVVQLRVPEGTARDPVALTRARVDGTFEFLSAPPGNWILESYREVYPGDVAQNDPLGMTARMPLSVGDEDIDDLEVRLQSGVTVSARLEFLEPPPEYDPRRSFVRLGSIGHSLGNGDWTTTADSFVATGVAPGEYSFYVRIQPNWHIASVTRGGRDITGQAIDVATSDVTDLVLSLTTRPTEVTGSVTPPMGTELQGTHVALFSVDRERFNAASLESVSVGLDGRFRFRDVIPGEYFVAAVPEAELDDWPAAALLSRIAGFAERVSVQSGQQVSVRLEVVR